jgi:hypothetical protein
MIEKLKIQLSSIALSITGRDTGKEKMNYLDPDEDDDFDFFGGFHF